MKFFFLSLFALVSLAISGPATIALQGMARDTQNQPLTSVETIKIYVYESGTNSLLWQETHPNTPIINGVYSLALGSVMAIDGLDFTKSLEMAMVIGSDSLIARVPLRAVPYAFHSSKADSALHANTATSATNATNATNADSAFGAYKATFADTAKWTFKALEAHSATNAINATNAIHANVADSAVKALNADNAINATHAAVADSAAKASKIELKDLYNTYQGDNRPTCNATKIGEIIRVSNGPRGQDLQVCINTILSTGASGYMWAPLAMNNTGRDFSTSGDVKGGSLIVSDTTAEVSPVRSTLPTCDTYSCGRIITYKVWNYTIGSYDIRMVACVRRNTNWEWRRLDAD